MKRIRIGKDIQLRFDVLTNGKPDSLEGRDLRLELVNPLGGHRKMEFTVSSNTIQTQFKGTEQKLLGAYRLTLWENFGKDRQSVVDVCEAFRLVRLSCEEGDTDAPDVGTETVSLGTVGIQSGIPGYSAYEIAVRNGFEGSEEEWLESLKGEKGDSLKYADLTEEQKQELQQPAKDAADEVRKTNEEIQKAEEGRIASETQRNTNESKRESTFRTLSEELSSAIGSAEDAAQKVAEAVEKIPTTITEVKETDEVTIE